MKSKKWLVAALGATMVCGAAGVRIEWQPRMAWARDAGEAANPYQSAVKAKFDALAEQLNLSNEQKTAIGDILRDAFGQGRAIGQRSDLNSAQKQQKLLALRAATRAKIEKLLSPTQQAAAQKLFAQRESRVQNTLREIADELQMTASQRAEAKPIIETAAKQARAIIQDAAVPFPQKRARLTQLRQSTREQLASILTPEQLAKLDTMRDAVRSEILSRVSAFGLPIGQWH